MTWGSLLRKANKFTTWKALNPLSWVKDMHLRMVGSLSLSVAVDGFNIIHNNDRHGTVSISQHLVRTYRYISFSETSSLPVATTQLESLVVDEEDLSLLIIISSSSSSVVLDETTKFFWGVSTDIVVFTIFRSKCALMLDYSGSNVHIFVETTNLETTRRLDDDTVCPFFAKREPCHLVDLVG